MKLNQIFTNFQDFKTKSIDYLMSVFGTPDWLNESLSLLDFNKLFFTFNSYYGDRTISYNNETIFLTKFNFILADKLPDLFYKQQMFLQDKLYEFLRDGKNRAIIVDYESSGNRNNSSSSNNGDSQTPVNLVVDNVEQLSQIPLTSASLSSLRGVENYNNKNTEHRYNLLSNIRVLLDTNFSLSLSNFMKYFNGLFTSVIVNDSERECSDEHCCVFKNGYYVSEVDYLGVDNQQAIQHQNNKIESNTTSINNINGKLNNYYNKQEIDSKLENIDVDVDLSNYYTKEQTNHEIEQAISQIPQPDLSNVVKKNETNTITTDKLLTSTNQNNTVYEIVNNYEKKMYFDFIQSKGGYRNWNHLIFRAKLRTNDYVNIIDLYSKDVSNGLWLNVENNKINFDTPTLIGGVATPIGNNDVANKLYVDNKISQIPATDLSNYYNKQEINNYRDEFINNYPDYFYLERYYYTQEQVNELVNTETNINGVGVKIPNQFVDGKQVYGSYKVINTTGQYLLSNGVINGIKSFTISRKKNDGAYAYVPSEIGKNELYRQAAGKLYLNIQSSSGYTNDVIVYVEYF